MRAPSLTFREKGTKSYCRSSIRSVPVIPPEEEDDWDGLTPIYPTISNELWLCFTGCQETKDTWIEGWCEPPNNTWRYSHSFAMTFRFNQPYADSGWNIQFFATNYWCNLNTGVADGTYTHPTKFQLNVGEKIYEGIEVPMFDNIWHTFIYTCDYDNMAEPVCFYLDGVKGTLDTNNGNPTGQHWELVQTTINSFYDIRREIWLDAKDYILFDGILNITDIEKYIKGNHETITNNKLLWLKMDETAPTFEEDGNYDNCIIDSTGQNIMTLHTTENLDTVFDPHTREMPVS
jgi:hypothetical protein